MSEVSIPSKWTSEAGPEALFGGQDAPLFGRRQRRARGPRLPVFVLLGNGCLCCNVRTDLQETLRGLLADRARGAVPSFERVVIETSGLADPGPVLQTFATDRGLGREFHMQALITVVDAVNGQRNIERMPEAKKQVALADRIVLTKSDLADAATTGHLIEQLGALSATPVGIALGGEIDPSFLLAEPPAPRDSFDLGGPEHTHGLCSFALIFEKAMSWAGFQQAMAVLTGCADPIFYGSKASSRSRNAAGRSSSMSYSMWSTRRSNSRIGRTATGGRGWYS
jgi:G3E family GTPase